jgi:hypothetical protein
MQSFLWVALIIITGLCFIGLTIILRGAYRESKLRRRNASVRKWLRSESAALGASVPAPIPGNR